jgi:glycosyltransferase involved in cell wall biosynthesis
MRMYKDANSDNFPILHQHVGSKSAIASATIPDMPLVSIGMPLFNAERYLSRTLDSILDQTFRNFELIISDNGSSDRTETICREYARRDSRILYWRNEENRGAAWNFNRVLKLARGSYFKWAAYDDLLAPQFLERCLAALEQNPSAVLSFCRFRDIDDNGNPIGDKSPEACKFAHPYTRMQVLIRRSYTCEEVFGLIRTHILRKTPGIGAYTGSDQNLLMELALHGSFCETADVLFSHRWHAQSSCILMPDGRKRWLWFDPAAASRRRFPLWKQFREYGISIRRSPLSLRERLKCYQLLLNWLHSNKRSLIMEAYYHDSTIAFLNARLPFVRRMYRALRLFSKAVRRSA